MLIVTLKLPDVKRKTKKRPKVCPNCQGQTFQGWGEAIKPVRDSCYRTVKVKRYRCCHCRKTFRHYPQGVDRADQTQRMRKLAVIMWVLGLSLRGVRLILTGFGVSLCHMTVWRDLQDHAALLEKRRRWQPARVLGLDGAYPLGWGKKQPVLIAVDLGRGQPVAIGYLDEANPDAVYRFLKPLVQRLGVSVIVTDDLASYRIAAERLGVEHQVCQYHARRWIGHMLYELRETVPKEWEWVLDEIQSLLNELPLEGSRRLFELWKQIPERRVGQSGERSPLERLRYLLIRMSDNWDRYRLFDWQQDVPWTNNGTEQVIGKMKNLSRVYRGMRSRTVRGYKSWQGMWAGLLLSGSDEVWKGE